MRKKRMSKNLSGKSKQESKQEPLQLREGNNAMFEFNMGETLRERVTGFIGVVMARTDYFTDCSHYGLQSKKLDKDGKPVEWQWFDETRLEKVKGSKKLLQKTRKPTSGPHPNAPEN